MEEEEEEVHTVVRSTYDTYRISRAQYMSATEIQQLRMANDHHVKMLLCAMRKEKK